MVVGISLERDIEIQDDSFLFAIKLAALSLTTDLIVPYHRLHHPSPDLQTGIQTWTETFQAISQNKASLLQS